MDEKKTDDVNKKKEQVKDIKKSDAEKKIKEVTELLQRNQAEFDNYRKRVEKEKANLIKNASKDIIVKLLPLLDNFELALNNTDNNGEFVKGMELIYSQMFQMLEEQGLKKIDAIGRKFDPYFHEALLAENYNDKEDEIVLEELQKGYVLNDDVIRHAKVKINKRGKK